ncbi:MAG: SUMF1/EgtB/PvdO family nonheme iron enzyme, partial [Myxococcota bacterium]
GARVVIRPYRERGGYRELGQPVHSAAAPLTEHRLDPGSYRIELSAPGHQPVVYPLAAVRAETLDIAVALPPEGAVPADMVYIPAGRFLYGSDFDDKFRDLGLDTQPLRPVTTAAYLIGRTEVTMRAWLAFARTLPAAERAQRLPRHPSGKVVESADGRFALHFRATADVAPDAGGGGHVVAEGELLRYRDRQRRVEQDWLDFPVFSVSFDDAQAYAAWLDRTGQVPGARLCTEYEWERAARGADDRVYPHGDILAADDANHDLTYGRKPGGFGPDAVGSYPVSHSPFGLADMAGNVWEWVRSVEPAAGEVVIRGGDWFRRASNSLSCNRSPGTRDWLMPQLGVRICADVDPQLWRQRRSER